MPVPEATSTTENHHSRDRSVTVVIPTHNRPALVSRAVKSVLQQSIRPKEIIVVDDGSDAQTQDAINSMVTLLPNLRVIRLDPSEGASSARNVGIAAATSELVAFLDDDDEWMPGKLERQLLAYTNRNSIVTCGAVVMTGDNRRRSGHRAGAISLRRLLWENVAGETSRLLASTTLCRATLFDSELPSGQDFDFVARALEQGNNLVMVDEALVRIHKHCGPRISTNLDAKKAGLTVLLRKHGRYMTPAQRRFHRYKIALLELATGSRNGLRNTIASLLAFPWWISPREWRRVGGAVVRWFLSSLSRIQTSQGSKHARSRNDIPR